MRIPVVPRLVDGQAKLEGVTHAVVLPISFPRTQYCVLGEGIEVGANSHATSPPPYFDTSQNGSHNMAGSTTAASSFDELSSTCTNLLLPTMAGGNEEDCLSRTSFQRRTSVSTGAPLNGISVRLPSNVSYEAEAGDQPLGALTSTPLLQVLHVN
ncbi:hypothetical protein BD310DRAFT_309277 [Dichomitus squalens]|uniref:Uncharacterized protein n=1 Tax=Dichomitus squalens TaxID=114155 RepID=A0A4Q9Q0G8_9APHY|nr:hypothetical protein BD310DRAFT_309277 [Dichomitus squalens]